VRDVPVLHAGSGKTYTMMGTPEDPGIIPRLCGDLFDHVREMSTELMTFTVEVSYVEIYNENMYDLLSADAKDSHKKPLKMRNHKCVIGTLHFCLSLFLWCCSAVRTRHAVPFVPLLYRSCFL
jgi:hypothetical protein